MVFAIARSLVQRKNLLDAQRVRSVQSGTHGHLELIGFTVQKKSPAEGIEKSLYRSISRQLQLDASKALSEAVLQEGAMQSHTVRRITSRALGLLVTLTHSQLDTSGASIISSSGRPVRLGSVSNVLARDPRADRSRSLIAAPPERSEDMRTSRSCLALLLSLMLFAGLAGCGPASSDNAPSLGPNVSVGGPSLSKQGPSPRNDSFTPFTSAASPVSLASVNGTGSASGTERVPGGDSPHAVPVLSSEPGPPVDGLVVPEWMAQKLNSPNVRVRLRALETWAQSAPPGAVDPLILAFEDKDERVRARAQQLIEQDWERKAEAEK
jgi:hypothetical protein